MKTFSRRSFIRSGIALGGTALAGSQMFPEIVKAGLLQALPDIVHTPGDEPMEAVGKLINALGGAEKFIQKGDTVGILVNSPWKNAGYFTHPDVALAVVEHLLQAGAAEIVCFKPVPEGYWEKSRYFNRMKEKIGQFRYGNERKTVVIPGGTNLAEAEIFTDFEEVDKYVSIPVAKHHAGVFYSGTLKGLMGVSSSDTNRKMHSPSGEYTYEEHEWLSQCIADLNLLRQPDLCVVDALECGLTNGPRGPGETIKPNVIIAGTDMVAVDAFSANMIGFATEDLLSVSLAARKGLGTMDLEGLTIQAI